MLKKHEVLNKYIDVMLIEQDYIITQGLTYTPFSNKCKINGRKVLKPILGIWRVHRDYPLIIEVLDHSVNIELKKNDKKIPKRVYRNKIGYGLTTFVLFPADLDIESINRHWKKVATLDRAFKGKNGEGPVTIGYLEHRQDLYDIDIAVHLVGMQLPLYLLDNFFSKTHRIYSHRRTFYQSLEGKIEMSPKQAEEVNFKVIDLLEKRYKTNLLNRIEY
jgi:hypothetical protein